MSAETFGSHRSRILAACVAVSLLGGLAARLAHAEGNTNGPALYPVTVNDRWGAIDRTGRLVIQPILDREFYFQTNAPTVVSSGGKWGAIDSNGQYVVRPSYVYLSPFQNGQAVASDGKRSGIVDESGRLVVPLKYDRIRRQRNGWFIVTQEGLSGLLDATGRLAFAPKFERFGDLREGFLPAVGEPEGKQDMRWGYVDTNGTFVIEPTFKQASPFFKGAALVTLESGEQVRIDHSGAKQPTERAFKDIFLPSNAAKRAVDEGRVVLYMSEEKVGFMGTNGVPVIPARFDGIELIRPVPFIGFPVEEGGKWGFVGRNGHVWIEPKYEEIAPHVMGHLLGVKQNGKWRLVSTNAQEVGTAYHEISSSRYSEGLVPVRIANRWGFSDTHGQLAVEAVFEDQPRAFRHGLARIGQHAIGYIERTGKWVWPRTDFVPYKCPAFPPGALSQETGERVREIVEAQVAALDISERPGVVSIDPLTPLAATRERRPYEGFVFSRFGVQVFSADRHRFDGFYVQTSTPWHLSDRVIPSGAIVTCRSGRYRALVPAWYAPSNKLRATVGEVVLLRAGMLFGAIRVRQDSFGGNRQTAEYDWVYQPDGSGNLRARNVQRGRGRAAHEKRARLGDLFAPLHESRKPPKHVVACGPLKLLWHPPATFSLDMTGWTRTPQKRRLDVAATGTNRLDAVDVFDPSLVWRTHHTSGLTLEEAPYVPIRAAAPPWTTGNSVVLLILDGEDNVRDHSVTTGLVGP